MNQKRWVLFSLAAASFIVFAVLNQALQSVWDYFRLPIYSEWVLGVPTFIALALGLLLFGYLFKSVKVNLFVTDVIVELSKVTVPKRKETFLSAVVVIVMVSLASVILFFFDVIWGAATQKLMNL
jgi:preprotein translocase SecE subunit